MSSLLLYHQQLEQTPKLIDGRLLILEEDEITSTYVATSGQPNHQTISSLSVRGRGGIPPNLDISHKKYTVLTAPIAMPNVPGVSGNFYKINPHTVQINGVTRGDFGIHFDANVPGSAGCIVIRNKTAWEDFEKQMREYAKQGIKELSLVVSYAR
jgi:hypothetical protein